MEKKKNQTLKERIASGAGIAVGATVGMVAGSSVSANANEVELQEVDDSNKPNPGVVLQESADTDSEPVNDVLPDEENEPLVAEVVEVDEETSPVEDFMPDAVVADDPVVAEEVEVLSYEMDGEAAVALVNLDGEESMIVDVDGDGVADGMFVDVNEDGAMDESEVIALQENDINISMDSLRESFEMQDNSFMDSDDDYINDANVDDYMA